MTQFECPLCVDVFQRFSHLKWHLLSMHPRRQMIMDLVNERYGATVRVTFAQNSHVPCKQFCLIFRRRQQVQLWIHLNMCKNFPHLVHKQLKSYNRGWWGRTQRLKFPSSPAIKKALFLKLEPINSNRNSRNQLVGQNWVRFKKDLLGSHTRPSARPTVNHQKLFTDTFNHVLCAIRLELRRSLPTVILIGDSCQLLREIRTEIVRGATTLSVRSYIY